MIEQFLKPQDCQEIQNICEIQICLGSMRSQSDQPLSSCDASILQGQLQAAVLLSFYRETSRQALPHVDVVNNIRSWRCFGNSTSSSWTRLLQW